LNIGNSIEEMYDYKENIICYCSNVSKDEIVLAIVNGAKTLDDIRYTTKSCTIGRCKEFSPHKKCCSSEIRKLLKQYVKSKNIKKTDHLEKWKKCKVIGKEIVKELSQVFPDGKISYDMVFLSKMGVRVFGITLKYNGLSVDISVQDKKQYEKPFVYIDGIETQGESRGKGLAVKVLDSFSSLVGKNVFKHLNVKDMSGGFWKKMMERYDFIRDKYTTDYEDG